MSTNTEYYFQLFTRGKFINMLCLPVSIDRKHDMNLYKIMAMILAHCTLLYAQLPYTCTWLLNHLPIRCTERGTTAYVSGAPMTMPVDSFPSPQSQQFPKSQQSQSLLSHHANWPFVRILHSGILQNDLHQVGTTSDDSRSSLCPSPTNASKPRKRRRP